MSIGKGIQYFAVIAVFSLWGCKDEAPKAKSGNSNNTNSTFSQNQSQQSGFGNNTVIPSGQGIGVGATCSNNTDQFSCQNAGSQCLWNPQFNSCQDNATGGLTGSSGTNACAGVVDQNQCNGLQAQGCSWGIDHVTNQVRCGHQCEQNSDQNSCMNATTLGCQWGQPQPGTNLYRCLPAGSLPQQGGTFPGGTYPGGQQGTYPGGTYPGGQQGTIY